MRIDQQKIQIENVEASCALWCIDIKGQAASWASCNFKHVFSTNSSHKSNEWPAISYSIRFSFHYDHAHPRRGKMTHHQPLIKPMIIKHNTILLLLLLLLLPSTMMTTTAFLIPRILSRTISSRHRCYSTSTTAMAASVSDIMTALLGNKNKTGQTW